MPRELRADARRNRARVLEVAGEVFATEGLTVPVHEIARRAGVGTGTVSRHFPTKEALIAAILLERMGQLLAEPDEPAGDSGERFFRFFGTLIRAGAANRGLAEALAGTGYDLDAAAAEAGYDLSGHLRTLLADAQRAGAVRADIEFADLKALMVGCQSHPAAATDPAALDRIIDVATTGLRAAGKSA
ncbi:TetR/AcrR family transcriptional regulator [Catenuloplanes atrovinosus]|uniref:AcrR family transcriptional regulator n=1 Tax=Catenuloplanes atrovinosus TaxID=137266 RepID=A0AAE3YVD3_9ACTN|nr:helix-turn-helix domain-containing protein [Catenuloplanes atrovinosus]MDR7279084.1 AcrR family transcriptional regulator [Catenuloplanes atrovinosus]